MKRMIETIAQFIGRATGRYSRPGFIKLGPVIFVPDDLPTKAHQEAFDAYMRDDIPTLLRLLRPMADKGDTIAQMALGYMYIVGEGVEQDGAEAAKWLRPAAEKDEIDAQFNLGLLYGEGLGVQQDFGEAMKWMRRAADQGATNAQYILANMYAGGYGVSRDDAEAAKWFRVAAEQGEEFAQRELGIMYDHGQGVPRDPVKAYMWFSLGMFGGNEDDEKYIRKLARKLTPEQIKEADRLVKEWRRTGPPRDNG